MDRVTLLVLFLLAAAVGPDAARADGDIARWQGFIAEAAHRFAIPERWIRDVMRVESGGRTLRDGQPIVSAAGALGLMQLMPETYEEMRRRHGLGPDPQDPRNSILAGAAYLRDLHDRYGDPGLFAAYHAGPGRYAAYLAGDAALPAATARYLAALGVTLPPSPAPSASSLFVVLGGLSSAGLFAIPAAPAPNAESP